MANTTRPPAAPDGPPADLTSDGPAAVRTVPSGLAGRVYALRGAQAELDGETRMRRLLAAVLIVQVPLAIVMLLSSAWVPLLVDVLAVVVTVGAALVFGPHDGDRHTPAKDEATAALVAGQQAEIAALQEESAQAAAATSLLADLARRHRALLVRQLTKIDELEAKEQDPAQLSDLFVLDHLATRMRRCSEGVLVLSGRDEVRSSGTPVAASEVLRGAVAEIEDFSRVEVTLDRDVVVAGPAVVDVVHLLAELIENATVFSSPSTPVRVHGHATGEAFAVTITDQGVGLPPERLAEVNRWLAEDAVPLVPGQIGFQVVARLAARHGVWVGLASAAAGGTEATVVLPAPVVAVPPAVAVPVVPAQPLVEDVPATPSAAPVTAAPVTADASPWAGHELHESEVLPYVPSPVLDAHPAHAVPEPSTWDAAPAPVAPSAGAPAYPVESFTEVHPADHATPDPLDVTEPAAAHDATYASYEATYETTYEAAYDTAPTSPYPAEDLAEPVVPVESEAPSWDDYAWQTPAPASAPPEPEPMTWRETTQSPFVPQARVVDEPVAVPAEDLTRSGLQRRVPLANMAPQMNAPAAEHPDEAAAQPAPDRSRHLFSAYRDGLTLGRHGLTSDLPAADALGDDGQLGEDR